MFDESQTFVVGIAEASVGDLVKRVPVSLLRFARPFENTLTLPKYVWTPALCDFYKPETKFT